MSMLRKKVDGYYLMERIGAGGTSEVFLGINPKTREKLAFKVFGKCESLTPLAHARFAREVDVIRSLSHPGIIRIMTQGIVEENCYYAMEYMPGGHLGQMLQRGKIKVDEALGLFLPICAAVAYAHECGVIHANLKPSNVLFNKRGEPAVADFGMANDLNFENVSAGNSGDILGIIAYLAPEQRFSSANVNRRTDVYALGAILYEMLMGFPPLGNFPKASEVHPEFSGALQGVLGKCLAVEPEERFEDAGQVKLELEKSLKLPAPGIRVLNPVDAPVKKKITIGDLAHMPPVKTDHIESWFRILRTGTIRERLAVVREMVDKIRPSEAKSIVKLYPEEGDRVRWGLIRVLGELKIESATPLILSDLRNSFHAECAIEALGKIGSDEAYDAIVDYAKAHPENAAITLSPLARTGKHRATNILRNYLGHDSAVLRQAAVQALGIIHSQESLQILKEQLCLERDEQVRLSLTQAVHSLHSILQPNSDSPEKAENHP